MLNEMQVKENRDANTLLGTLNEMQVKENRDAIVKALLGTSRIGMDALVEWLLGTDFFTSPASTRFHGCYEGGLAAHSLNVHREFNRLCEACGVEVARNSSVIACLLHDVCKIGAYLGDAAPYKSNRDKPKGHAVLSIERIKKHILLTELEEKMILYHMGVYGLTEFDKKRGEYPLRGGGMAHAWHHHPAVKLMYFADEIATLREKAEERGEPQNIE